MSRSTSSLFAPLFGDDEIAALFGDAGFVARMVAVEAALARAESRVGLIPTAAAAAITAAVATFEPDFARLRAATEKAGVPVAGLVEQLRVDVGPAYGDAVHYGATTQDIMDTARVLQLRDAGIVLARGLDNVIEGLARLADRHRHTLQAGRTHSQQAVPITFGLKAAGWLAPLLRHRQRLAELRPRLLVVELGGAAGTLAAFGEQGPAVQAALAAELELGLPLGVWHTQRDTVVEMAAWATLVTGSLAKMGQDVILLAQSEVGELRETAGRSRGGSSTMPQKANPMVSEALVAIHRTGVAHLAALQQALLHEQERATGSWQVEWLNLPPLVELAAAALRHGAWLAANLAVDAGRMRANVMAARGLLLGEALRLALTPHMGREAAGELLGEAVAKTQATGRHLVDVVRERVDYPLEWERLREEANYLGATGVLIDRILKAVEN